MSRHPHRVVDTVASDDENVRLKIYDGDLPLGNAGNELLQLALASHHRHDWHMRVLAGMWERIEAAHADMMTPWPVRWCRYAVRRYRVWQAMRKAAL